MSSGLLAVESTCLTSRISNRYRTVTRAKQHRIDSLIARGSAADTVTAFLIDKDAVSPLPTHPQASSSTLGDVKYAVEETKTSLMEMYEGEDAYTGVAWAKLSAFLNTNEETVEGPWVLDEDGDLNYVYYEGFADMHIPIPLTCTSRTGQRGRPVICNADPVLLQAASKRMKETFAAISEKTRVDLGEQVAHGFAFDQDESLKASIRAKPLVA